MVTAWLSIRGGKSLRNALTLVRDCCYVKSLLVAMVFVMVVHSAMCCEFESPSRLRCIGDSICSPCKIAGSLEVNRLVYLQRQQGFYCIELADIDADYLLVMAKKDIQCTLICALQSLINNFHCFSIFVVFGSYRPLKDCQPTPQSAASSLCTSIASAIGIVMLLTVYVLTYFMRHCLPHSR